MAHVGWDAIAGAAADANAGRTVEVTGWLAPTERPGYALLCAEPPCCCPPRNPAAAIEVFSDHPLRAGRAAVRVRGRWHPLAADAAGWRYQLRDARLVGGFGVPTISRRGLLAALPLAFAIGRRRAWASELAAGVTVDMHSHAGEIIGVRNIEQNRPFSAVAQPMRAGGMSAACFAIVSDGPVHKVMPDGRIHPYRTPEPGELYAFGRRSFQRLHAMIADQQLALIATAADLRAAAGGTPGAIVAAEGGDFLEGNLDRIDEAYAKYTLRHLQLTHYRVNELGDIQTEDPVHGGLTDLGAAAIQRCNKLGIVVDVAHGTLDLVKRAASVTTKPLILSHTSLVNEPRRYSRAISPEHAKLIASTGGVIGVWPPESVYRDLAAMAGGMARLAAIVGVDHVGLGTDSLGLTGPSIFDDYRQLPELAKALLGVGFSAAEAAKILGGNYQRVFEATLA
jgi:membrane dipeptidase